VVFGSAFLAVAIIIFWEKHELKNCGVRVGLKKAVVFGSAFLAGAVVF